MGDLFRKLASSLLPRASGFRTAAPAFAPPRPAPEEFQLHLSADWQEFPSDDPQQWLFGSDTKRTGVVVSVWPVHLTREKLLEAAQEVANQRRSAELQARDGRSVEFGDIWVELKEDGEIGHVAYAGYDEHTIFRFMGWVTEAKILNLRVETETRDNEFAKAVFDEVFAGFRFYVP